MSATADNTYADGPESLRQDILSAMEGGHEDERAKRIYHGLTTQWGMPETLIGTGGRTGVPLSALRQKAVENPDWLEDTYGDRNVFVKAMGAGTRYQESGHEIRAVDEATTRSVPQPGSERALVDESIVGAASPVDVDPLIVDVQRSSAPVLNVIQTQAQPGFTAQYNIIDNRDDPVGFLSEAEAAGDLENQFSTQSFSLPSETKDMKIQLGLVKVSDFTQRAQQTLEYMDPRQTALGQATVAHALQKARAIFYGDPSVNAGDQSIEDGDAYEGLAKIFDDAGNSTDKSTVSSGFLEDLLDEVTVQVENTGLTWDRARYLVSPRFYNAVYNEVTPVVRLDGYDANVEYGPQGLAIGTEMGSVGITPCPNIRSYSGFTGTASNSDPGDVFLIDELAHQFRQLAPMSTVPLGRTGLADRVAMFEYGTLIDKDHGNHGLWLQSYDI
jgi:hypothetical protein